MRYFIYLFLVITISFSSLYSDDVALGSVGSSVWPLQVNDISMEREIIGIEIYEDSSVFNCEFTFFNHDSNDVTLLVGFPARYFDKETYIKKYGKENFWGAVNWDDFELYNFQCRVSGSAVQVTKEVTKNYAYFKSYGALSDFLKSDYVLERYRFHLREGDVYENDCIVWYTWPVTFKACDSVTISHRYRIKNSHQGACNFYIQYILRTGRFWKDNRIGKVDIMAHFNIFPYIIPNFEDWSYGNETIEWHLTDYLPEKDLRLDWMCYERESIYASMKRADADKVHLSQYEDNTNYQRAKQYVSEDDTKEALRIFKHIAENSLDERLKVWADYQIKSLK